MYSWTLDRTLSHRMWRLMNDVLLILPVYFTYSCCLKKDFACLLEQRSKKIGQNVKGRSNFVLFNFALLSRLWRREVCKLCVDLLKIPAIFCLKTAYESIATVGESRVWWRADFQIGSRVLKKVFWTFSYLYLWHTMWFHAKKLLTAQLFATPPYFCWQLTFYRHLPTLGLLRTQFWCHQPST